MNLSKSDIAGCKAGLLFAIAVFALIPVICALISIKDLSVMNLVCGAMTLGGIYYVSCLCLGILFSVFDVILAFIVRLIVSLFQKIIPHRKKGVGEKRSKCCFDLLRNSCILLWEFF